MATNVYAGSSIRSKLTDKQTIRGHVVEEHYVSEFLNREYIVSINTPERKIVVNYNTYS